MAGKNKVNRWFTVQQDDSAGTPRDLTADLVPNSMVGAGLVFDQADMTGQSDPQYNYLADHAKSDISAQFYLDDTATTGALTVLQGAQGKVGTLTMNWGSGAAPTTGDPVWSGEYLLYQAQMGVNGNKPVLNCKWAPGNSTGGAWSTHA